MISSIVSASALKIFGHRFFIIALMAKTETKINVNIIA